MASFYVTVTTATGMNGPLKIPEGFLNAKPDPTPLEVAAEFTRRMVEDAEKSGMPRDMGFRAPLTILVEEGE